MIDFCLFMRKTFFFFFFDPEWRGLKTRPLGITHRYWGWAVPREITLLLACPFSTHLCQDASWVLCLLEPAGTVLRPTSVWLPVTATELCSSWQWWRWPWSLLMWLLSRADSVHMDMILKVLCMSSKIPITITYPNKGSGLGLWRRYWKESTSCWWFMWS